MIVIFLFIIIQCAFVDGGERKVGDPAKRQAITNPTRTIFSIKRFMLHFLKNHSRNFLRSVQTSVDVNTRSVVIAFHYFGGERKVGDPAKRQAITNPTRTIFSIKRFMGENWDQVQKT